jgi:hypothetical protein
MINDNAQCPAAAAGFDAPEEALERDYLERRQIAATVYNLLVTAPQDWSMRVGVFGAWGEGKTTVCKFIDGLARSEGHIVLWFNPWTANSMDQLWALFANNLIDALTAAGLRLKGTVLSKVIETARKNADPVQRLAEVNIFAKAGIGAGIALLGKMFKTDRLFIERIRGQFPDKRIIVIIDDLDRAPPGIVPTLLLSLRELLDVPTFSFLLPFDPDIISKSLVKEHPAWGSGDRFLEKIIDFRLRLPIPTFEQRRRLFLENLEVHCPHVPTDAMVSTLHLLPDNPRRIKALVRSLAMLKDEVARHGDAELDWSLIMFSALIRVESSNFLEAYVEEVFRVSPGEPDRWLELAVDPKDAAKCRHEMIEQSLNASDVSDQRMRERLKQICEAMREQHPYTLGVTFQYHSELLTRPHAMTWREFEQLLAIEGERSASENWLRDHAARRQLEMDAVLDVLLRTLVNFYDARLEVASRDELLSEHDAEMVRASKGLVLLRDLIGGRVAASLVRKLIEERRHFEAFLEVAFKWAHFEKNETDHVARIAERDTLVEWLAAVGDEVLASLADLVKEHHDPFDEPARAELKRHLLENVKERLAKLVMNKLSVSGGMHEFFDQNRHAAARWLLFDLEGPIWTGRGRERVSEILATASSNGTVQKNARRWLELACRAKTGGFKIDQATINAFMEAKDTVPVLWTAAVASPLQYRMLSDTRKLRTDLIEYGGGETRLPIPNWLHENALFHPHLK